MQKLWVLLSILIWESVFQSQPAYSQALFDLPEDARIEKREDDSNFGGRLMKREDESYFDGRLMKRGEDSRYNGRLMKRTDDESNFDARLMKRMDETSYNKRIMKKEDDSFFDARLTNRRNEDGLGKNGKSYSDSRRRKSKRFMSDYSKRLMRNNVDYDISFLALH